LSDRIFSEIFHLIRQIVSFERKQLLFNYLSHKEMVKRKRNHWIVQRGRVGLSTLSGVLGACELGHDLQTREGIKPYPSLCIFLVPGNLGTTFKNQREHQDLPFSLYILGAWELGHNLQSWKGLKTYPSPIQNTMVRKC
jgi:hypothetical protein